MRTTRFVDRAIRYILLAAASLSILIVFLIAYFTVREAWPALREIGLARMLTTPEWRPQRELYGLLPMLVGSLMVTAGAVVLGVPLAIGAAVFLAEVAPRGVAEAVRPAVQLLAGIPSVVYGLFGLVVLVPVLRRIPASGNSGFGILAASIVLAVMILPTVTSVSEDAIRSVPRDYREGSLALGTTHWQTILGVILPAARSGILAGVILGIGRALGETMAMIMVIGNSIVMPAMVDNNPLTLILSRARTLTGNVAVEINYASGLHESALFATGVVLFALIMIVNSAARLMLRGKRYGSR